MNNIGPLMVALGLIASILIAGVKIEDAQKQIDDLERRLTDEGRERARVEGLVGQVKAHFDEIGMPIDGGVQLLPSGRNWGTVATRQEGCLDLEKLRKVARICNEKKGKR